MQINTLFLGIRSAIPVKFLHKQIWHRQAEPIDALLHVSHHEGILLSFRPTRYIGEQQFLDIIAVLVLVDENLLIFLGKLPGCLGGRTDSPLPLHQDIQGKVLHVCEIQQVLLPLFRREGLPESQGHLHQHLCWLLTSVQILQNSPGRRIEILFSQLRQDFFHLLAILLHSLFEDQGDPFVLLGGQPGIGRLLKRRHHLIIVADTAEFFHQRQIRLHHRLIHIRTVRRLGYP